VQYRWIAADATWFVSAASSALFSAGLQMCKTVIGRCDSKMPALACNLLKLHGYEKNERSVKIGTLVAVYIFGYS